MRTNPRIGRNARSAIIAAVAAIAAMSLLPSVQAVDPTDAKGCAQLVHEVSLNAKRNYIKVTSDGSDTSASGACSTSATWQPVLNSPLDIHCLYAHDVTGPAAPQFVGLYIFPAGVATSHGAGGTQNWDGYLHQQAYTGLSAGQDCQDVDFLYVPTTVGDSRMVIRVCNDDACATGDVGNYDVNSDGDGAPGNGNAIYSCARGLLQAVVEPDPLSVVTAPLYHPGDLVRVVVTSKKLDGSAIYGAASGIRVNVSRPGNVSWLSDLTVSEKPGGVYETWVRLPTDAPVGDYRVHARRTTTLVEPASWIFRVKSNDTADLQTLLALVRPILGSVQYLGNAELNTTGVRVADKAGYTLTSGERAALADAVWDEPGADHTAAGSFGARVDAATSSRAPASTAVSNADLTPTRVAKLDSLDATVSSRAPAATAVSNADLTGVRIAKLDSLDVAVSSRALASTAVSNVDLTLTRIQALDLLDASVSSRAPAATAVSSSDFTVTRIQALDRLDVAVTTRAPASTAVSTADLTSARIAKLDSLDVAVSSRAPASTAVSSTDLTAARIAKLDALDAAVSSRAPASTAVSNADLTLTRVAKLDSLDATVSSRAPAATAVSNADLSLARVQALDRLDVAVSSRSTDASIWSYSLRLLTGSSDPTASQISEAVWTRPERLLTSDPASRADVSAAKDALVAEVIQTRRNVDEYESRDAGRWAAERDRDHMHDANLTLARVGIEGGLDEISVTQSDAMRASRAQAWALGASLAVATAFVLARVGRRVAPAGPRTPTGARA